MRNETHHNFSIRSVPDEWHEAAEDAPELDTAPLRRGRSLTVMPSGDRLDATTAFIAGIVLSALCGFIWYSLETERVSASPWLGLVPAVVIALAVRLGGTAADRETRAVLSSVFYLVTVMATIYAIERAEFVNAYGESPGLAEAETAFVRDRLSEPAVVLSWVAGLILCMQLSYLTGRHRPSIGPRLSV